MHLVRRLADELSKYLCKRLYGALKRSPPTEFAESYSAPCGQFRLVSVDSQAVSAREFYGFEPEPARFVRLLLVSTRVAYLAREALLDVFLDGWMSIASIESLFPNAPAGALDACTRVRRLKARASVVAANHGH